ncbi:hypothetical protein Tco_1001663, partial [Tanacetum coccineum]
MVLMAEQNRREHLIRIFAGRGNEPDLRDVKSPSLKHNGFKNFEFPHLQQDSPQKSEKKDRQNLAKAQAKRAGEVTPLRHACPNPADETAGSVPKHVVATFATGPQTANPNNVKHVAFSDAHSIHSVHDEDEVGSVAEHQFLPEWGLRNDLRVCSFRACKEMITHLATPIEDEFLGGLTNIKVVQRAYQSLGRCVLLQVHANDGLSKEFSLLDSVHSSCEDKERELLDQLKDMERERDDWRRTALKQVEKIKMLEDIKGKARTLENENVKLVAGLAQAEMDHHKLILKFV